MKNLYKQKLDKLFDENFNELDTNTFLFSILEHVIEKIENRMDTIQSIEDIINEAINIIISKRENLPAEWKRIENE